MDDFLALKLKQAFALVLSCGGVVLISMGVYSVWVIMHPPGPISIGTRIGSGALSLVICVAGAGLEFVAVWLRGKSPTPLNAAINAVITVAALGAGLLSARMSYAQISGLQKFFLVVLAVGAAVGGALFFFADSGKGEPGTAPPR